MHFWLHYTTTGGGGWGHPQGAVHLAAVRLGSKGAMVGTEWSNSFPSCMDRCRKRYSHFLGGSFLAGKSAWALSRYLQTEIADYCMPMRLKVHLGSVLESELRL